MKILIILFLVTITCGLKAQEETKQDTIRLDNPGQKDHNPLLEFGNEFNNPVFHQPLLDIKSRLLLDNIELRMSYAENFNFGFMDEELPDPSEIL